MKYLCPPRRRKAAQIRRREDEFAETDRSGCVDVDGGIGESGEGVKSSAIAVGGGEGGDGGGGEGGKGPSINHG